MKAQIFNFRFWVKETDPEILKTWGLNILQNAGFMVLKTLEHHFTPQGYTAIFLLAESHLAIHTFPEEQASYIELSSCVERQFNKFLDIINYGRYYEVVEISGLVIRSQPADMAGAIRISPVEVINGD